jgi:hypothetical protein
MLSPLQRLYKTKLALLAVILTVVGVLFLVLAHWVSGHLHGSWITNVPISDVGSALFTTGLIAIFFTYIDQVDADERANQRLRQVIKAEAPAIRDAVVEGFAFAPGSLTAVASPETLDKVIENSLSIRLGDAELAHDAYTDLREQVVRAPERWRDAQVFVALAQSSHKNLFVATIRAEYHVVPQMSVLRFACVSDLGEYRELLQDPSSTAAWYFEPVAGLDGASPEAFELLEFTLDGRPHSARRTARATSQVYSVTLPEGQVAAGQEIAVSYTYRVLVQRHGHLLHLDVTRPTKGFKATLSYGDCGIRYVNVLDYVAGVKQPRITRLVASDPTPSVEVAYDGWIFPKGGVAFVWVLDEEVKLTNR